ncbi:MAG: hypothetical protein WA434_16780 [Candidatus Acidiferrales bacterium]
MRFFKQHLISLVMITVLAAPVVMAGCAGRVETGYYQRWETDTHRHHEDFRRRNREEQEEYREWRHDQH